MEKVNLNVSEIFYSLQGEGARAGTPTVFIRLSGCSAYKSCMKAGVACDTEWASGADMTLEQIHEWIQQNAHGCQEITWTGGEPCDQLTEEIVLWFKSMNYFSAIETSGIKPPPESIDFICVSPKVAEHILARNLEHVDVDELKYVRHAGQPGIPKPSITAKHYYLSPHSDGFTINSTNVNHCIQLCKQHPRWKLSIQQHKLWNVL